MSHPISMRIRSHTITEVDGEEWAFLVSSSRGKPPYRVLLDERWPMGVCPCQSYACTKWPNFKRTSVMDPCRHLEVAWMFKSVLEAAKAVVHSAQEAE